MKLTEFQKLRTSYTKRKSLSVDDMLSRCSNLEELQLDKLQQDIYLRNFFYNTKS